MVKLIVKDDDGNEIPAYVISSLRPLPPTLDLILSWISLSHVEMPFLTAHVGLYNESATDPVDIAQGPSSSDPERMLYGTLVSSLHHLKDTSNQPGMFFIFPDVSVRRRGTYTLLVNLLRLTK